MKDFKSTPILLLLVLILLCFASCTSRSEAKANEQTEQTTPDVKYKTLRVKFVHSDIVTNIIVNEEDVFLSGDTVWALKNKDNPKENPLEIVYDFPVDHTHQSGNFFKVIIQ